MILPARGGGPCTHVRGSLLANSRNIVVQRGLEETYEARLSPEHVPTMRSVAVTEWYPIELGLEHYGILCDLIPDFEDQVEIGRQSARRLQLPHVKTLVRAMRVSGAVTPDRALTLTQKVFDRVLKGVDVEITRVGPKDARIHCMGIPLVRHSYFRNSWMGWYEETLGLTARKVYVRRISHDDDQVTYLASWV